MWLDIDKFSFVLLMNIKCSVTCGLGVKTRSVECSDIDIPCDVLTKPDISQRCDLAKCPQWEAGPWGEVCNTKNCEKKTGGGGRNHPVTTLPQKLASGNPKAMSCILHVKYQC